MLWYILEHSLGLKSRTSDFNYERELAMQYSLGSKWKVCTRRRGNIDNVICGQILNENNIVLLQ